MANENDLIRRGDALAEIKKSSDNARSKMAKADSLEDLSAWSAVVTHLDIIEGTIAALPAAPMGDAPEIKALMDAGKAFADFDALPVSAKRPDIFELRVRQPIMRAFAALQEKDGA